jgi:protein-disulfide isomerase
MLESILPTSTNQTPGQTTKESLFSGASPKLTFVMGVVTGVAAISLLGFILIVSTNYQFKTSDNKDSAKPAAQVNNNTNTPTPNQPPAKVSVTVKDTDYIRGDKNATVTLIEYSDLECPYCQRFHTSMEKLMTEFQGKIRWIYRHFPLTFHANAQKEAEAAECVGKLGGADKYWTFVDKIYERTKTGGTGFALTSLPKLAREVGVSESQFNICLDGGEFAAKVQSDLEEGAALGVQGTPTTFVNGTAVEGAVSYEQLKAVVEQALK